MGREGGVGRERKVWEGGEWWEERGGVGREGVLRREGGVGREVSGGKRGEGLGE